MTFPEQPVTLLVGANGAGKSAILEAIAIMLSPLADHFLGSKTSAKPFTQDDISNACIATRLELGAVLGEQISWSVETERRGSVLTKPTWEIDNLRAALSDVDSRLRETPSAEIPIAIYYPTGRAVLDIPLRIRTRHTFHQNEAWEGTLGVGETRFRLFFEWFRDREDIENERRARGETNPDPQLEAVRLAVQALLPGYRDLRVQRVGLRMTIRTPEGAEVTVNQLSDGEKCLLALVGDLARRLAIAGPGTSPREARGIVLIDEIELHLHPKWQRAIVPALRRTFPNCQFIVTTHSPQVISEVDPQQVRLLSRTEDGLQVEPALSTKGKDSNSLLREVFGDTERPKWMADKADLLRRYIDAAEYENARALLEEIGNSLGKGDPTVTALELRASRAKEGASSTQRLPGRAARPQREPFARDRRAPPPEAGGEVPVSAGRVTPSQRSAAKRSR